MRYQKFPPAKELLPFVECYFVWEGVATERTEIQSPPSCFCAMVFNYADPYRAFQNAADLQDVPKAFVCGLFTSNYHLVMNGTIGMIGIVFKGTALHNFYGFPMSHLVNNRIPLALILGPSGEDLFTRVVSHSGDEVRVGLLEEFALSHIARAKSRLSVIDEAVEFIDQQKGCTSVEKVADHLRISRRYLEKKFLEKVGVSPKFYARIKRFGSLSNYIAHNTKIDWQEIVLEYGFHDQSHLVKEFMEFNKMNPTNYHQLHRESTRFVKQ